MGGDEAERGEVLPKEEAETDKNETNETSGVPSEASESAEEKRVGFRGWLRGTAQKGLRNVGANMVGNVVWNAKALAGQGLSQVLHRSASTNFRDYQSLASHLETLIQADKGKAKIESISYLSEILKSKAPDYESLTQLGRSSRNHLNTGDAGPPVLVIGEIAPPLPQALPYPAHRRAGGWRHR